MRTRSSSRRNSSVVARHEHVVFVRGGELVPQFGCEGQRDILLDRAVEALGTAVDAAMAGIDDDREAMAWSETGPVPTLSPLSVETVEPVVNA